MSARNSKPRRNAPWEQETLARLHFLGGAGKMTGSRFLLETRESRVLVECGMHQGGKEDRALNSERFEPPAENYHALLLTHAHVDHCGLLPRLVGEGFSGRVHATGGTHELAKIILLDAAHIQESDAKHKNRRLRRSGKPPIAPLYTRADSERALELFRPRTFGERFEVTKDVDARFLPAGHILGAAHVEVWVRDVVQERKIVFSGDIGLVGQPMIPDPTPPEDADLLLMESTYGDRDHRPLEQTLDELAAILKVADESKKNVILPVFAVGRAQEVLYQIATLEREGRAPKRETVLDSPMAIDVTELYKRSTAYLARAGVERLEREDRVRLPERFRVTRDWTESAALNERGDMTILSASGMCDAGRIQHHLKHNLWREGTHVVFVGFQAGGSLGRRLVEGARRVRIMGEEVAVRSRIHTLGGFSAHAGRRELLSWCRRIEGGAREVCLVHGEPESSRALADAMRGELGIDPILPSMGDVLHLHKSGSLSELVRGRG